MRVWGFAAHCHLVSAGKKAVLIDCAIPVETVKNALDACGAKLEAIFLTHAHFDHILTADEMRDAFGVPLFVHEKDAPLLSDGTQNASLLFGDAVLRRPAERLLSDGDTIAFGDLSFRVCHTPGHTHGSVCYITDKAAFTGDTLFADCHGRTDLVTGDPAMMRASLEKLTKENRALSIYPGHGKNAVMGEALDLLLKNTDYEV